MGFGFGLMDTLFPVMFFLVFGIVIVGFIVTAAKGVSTWNKNNNSPRLTVEAIVASKRLDVTHHQHAVGGDPAGAQGFHTSTSTTYFVTFQVRSGDRIEFSVSGSDYGMIAEGDSGELTFQGTRYLKFERSC